VVSVAAVQRGSEQNSGGISLRRNQSNAGRDVDRGIISEGEAPTCRDMANEVQTIQALPRDSSNHRLEKFGRNFASNLT
jgi:hypothetical protein